MIRKTFILACLFYLSLCASLDQQWHSWKSQHSKTYGDEEEEDARREVWYDNYKKIVDHNNANRSYSIALNEFADLVSTPFHGRVLAIELWLHVETLIAAILLMHPM